MPNTTKIPKATADSFLESFFNQIEGQIQFGDTKASLLIAGNAILLAVSGGLIKILSGCAAEYVDLSCIDLSLSLSLSTFAAALLMLSLVCALLAARPSAIHRKRPPQLFLFSYVASLSHDEYVDKYLSVTDADLVREALTCIHGKAAFATHKFSWLKRAIDATLAGLALMLASIVVAIVTTGW
jgi:hypothetical protein